MLMDRRIRPWINKKIIEYIGEEEATLVDFVCSKVSVDVSISIYVKSDFLALYKRGFVIFAGDGSQHTGGNSG